MLIRRITLAALMAALVGGTLALPAGSSASPVAHASKCKKKHKRSAQTAKKKKRKCGGAGQSGGALPGQATHPNATPPTQTPTPTVSDVTVASNPVLDGDSTTGQVTISGPAPSGGQPVSLQSDSARATVPGGVVVAAGQTKASFPVDTTTGVSASAVLSASIGTSSDQVQLNIVSDPSVVSVSLESHCLTTSDSFTANRVTLDVPAPVDTPVSLSSNDPALTVPSSVVVPAGSKTALFTTTANAPSPDPATVVVTATLDASFVTDTARVSTTASTPAVSSVSLQPSSVIVGGPSSVTVTLDCEAPLGGTPVTLASDAPTIANPSQTTVTVPAGQLSATFSDVIDTFQAGSANISADTGTGGAQQAQLDVNSLGT